MGCSFSGVWSVTSLQTLEELELQACITRPGFNDDDVYFFLMNHKQFLEHLEVGVGAL